MSDAVISSVTAYKHDGCTGNVGGDSSSVFWPTTHSPPLKKNPTLCCCCCDSLRSDNSWFSSMNLLDLLGISYLGAPKKDLYLWIVWISTRSSILPSSNRKCFQLVLALRWTPQPISFFSVVPFCCALLSFCEVLQAALCFIKTVRHFHIKKSRKWHCRL